MMTMPEKIVVYQEDEARQLYDKDPLEDLAWYYEQKGVAVFTMCAACTHETVCTVFCNSGFGCTLQYAWFCEVCAHTYNGNAFWYPNQYDEKLMQHISLCTNMILDEIRAIKK